MHAITAAGATADRPVPAGWLAAEYSLGRVRQGQGAGKRHAARHPHAPVAWIAVYGRAAWQRRGAMEEEDETRHATIRARLFSTIRSNYTQLHVVAQVRALDTASSLGNMA